MAGLGLLLIAMALKPATALADAADFQGMPGMWKVQLQIHRGQQPVQSSQYWFCADDGSDPMDNFAAIQLPELERCLRQSTRRSTTALAWSIACGGQAPGRGRISFDSAEHYRGQLELPALAESIAVEGRHYAACTGPSD